MMFLICCPYAGFAVPSPVVVKTLVMTVELSTAIAWLVNANAPHNAAAAVSVDRCNTRDTLME
ncbi:hypothetical protein E4K72_05550 [Oxalobacteraceae bacterium OM1]|nr:hypothetical protein E4K72_05550 [Oxalobacteraceae bacterium OM1]